MGWFLAMAVFLFLAAMALLLLAGDEWFWAAVVFLLLGALGFLPFLVIYYWFTAAGEAAEQERARWRRGEAQAAGGGTTATDKT